MSNNIPDPIRRGSNLQALYNKSREVTNYLPSQRLNGGNSYRFGTTHNFTNVNRDYRRFKTTTDLYIGPFELGYTFYTNTKICQIHLNILESMVFLGNSAIPYFADESRESFNLSDASIYEKYYVFVKVYLYDEDNHQIFEGLYPPVGSHISIKWSYIWSENRMPEMTRSIWSRLIGVILVDVRAKMVKTYQQWWKGGDIYIDGRIG